jgi:lipopolysaccharide export system protein LptA
MKTGEKIVSLVLCAAFLHAGEKDERLRLIHADLLKRETIAQQTYQKLQGRVEFQQGGTVIKCDAATQIIDRDPVALIGNVHIYNESRTLRADTVYFYQKEKKQIASGRVLSITESDTTTADRLLYYESENKLVSQGNVRIANPKERTVLSGGYAEYFRSQKYGKVVLRPVLIKLDSLGSETMRIFGDTMQVFEGGERTVAEGEVRIVQPGTEATCQRAEYFKKEEKTVLTGSPKVLQSNHEISGDTLWLYLENAQLARALVKGGGLVASDADTLNKGRWVNKLTGQAMEFYFQDKKLAKVVVLNQATSLYHVVEKNQYKGVNEVTGDRIEVFFENGKVQRVRVISAPELSMGKYSPPKI